MAITHLKLCRQAISTPRNRHTDDQVKRQKGEAQLSQTRTTVFRSCVMRASFPSQHRVDLGEVVTSLAQQMSRPSLRSIKDLKRLGRSCLADHLWLQYEQQRMPANIRVSVDSDFAADRATRKSALGMVQRLGRHPVKTTSILQTSVGLSVSEGEFYALVHGTAHRLGLSSLHARPWNRPTFDHRVRQFKCEDVCENEAWASNGMFKHAASGSRT